MRILKKIPGVLYTIKRHFEVIMPRLTFIRVANLAVVCIEMLFKKSTLKSKPIIAKIEASSACNLRCKGCRTGEPLMEYRAGNMSVSDFEIIIDKIGKYVFEIVFYLWGEPLLNKKLPLLIEVAHQKNISSVISTNLHFLTEEMGKDILNSKLDKIIFCLDGWSQKSYGEVRIGGDFELAKRNISRFIELRRESKSKKPFLEWQYVVTNNNISEIGQAKATAKEWGVDRFVELVDWGNRLTSLDYFRGLEKAMRKIITRQNHCYWLWTSIVIQFDGNVFPCCHVANKGYSNRIYGNILSDSLNEVWNSEMYRNSRLSMKSKSLDSDMDFICKHCATPPIFS